MIRVGRKAYSVIVTIVCLILGGYIFFNQSSRGVVDASVPQVQANVSSASATKKPAATQTRRPTATPKPVGKTYILNKNTKKFHLPSCSAVGQMKESNKVVSTNSRQEIINDGYIPCKLCNP